MNIPFDHLDQADRLVATTNTNKRLKQLDDRAAIEKIIGILKTHQDEWDVPAAGVPVASVRLNFYQADTLLGNVGIGRSFLTALYRGGFFSRPSELAVYNELMAAAGLEVRLPRSDA